jgi:hypothetical protein
MGGAQRSNPRLGARIDGLLRFARNDGEIATHTPLSSPRRRGSSTPRLLGSIINVSGILDHPHARVMTTEYALAISRRISPEVCIFVALFESEGAGKTGCLLHPRSRVRFAQTKLHTSIQGSGKHSGLPCAMALRLTSCSPRRTALLPPSPALLIASLAPAPRRPNHTTSPYASGAYV